MPHNMALQLTRQPLAPSPSTRQLIGHGIADIGGIPASFNHGFPHFELIGVQLTIRHVPNASTLADRAAVP